MANIKFKSIELESFRPFKEATKIEFSSDSKKPLTIIHGQNTYGKTSILNAIQWAWYGHVKNQFNQNYKLVKLINSANAMEGQHFASVTIEFNVDSDTYYLQRYIEAKATIKNPERDDDFIEKLWLDKNDEAIENTDRVREILREFIPEPLSKFFFFDGETLTAYITLIEKDNINTTLKNSIQDILGLPAFESTKELLDETSDSLTKQKNNLQSVKDSNAAGLSQIETYEIHKGQHKDNLKDLETSLETEQNHIEDIEDKIKTFDDIGTKKRAIEEIESDIRDHATNEENLKHDLRDKISDNSWPVLIHKILTEKSDEINSEIRENVELSKTIMSTKTSIDMHKKSLSDEECSHCGHDLNQSDVAFHNEKIIELEEELKQFPELTDITELQNHQTLINKLNQNTTAERDGIKRTHGELVGVRISKRTAIKELKKLKEGYDDDLAKSYSGLAKELSNHRANVTSIETDIGKVADRIKDLDREIAKETNKLKNPADDEKFNNLDGQIKKRSFISAVIDNAKNKFMDNLKEQIQKDATEYFRTIATYENIPGERALEINDNYGLKTILSDEEEADGDSAGDAHTKAMSLISALIRNSSMKPTLFLDTPAGRIDESRRKPMIEHIGMLGEQTVMFVHDGEFKKDEIRKWGAEVINNEYTLYKISHRETKLITGEK